MVNLFYALVCYSGAPMVLAYRRQNEESFLDAMVQVFQYFGGVPRRVIFDNGRVSVKDGPKTVSIYSEGQCIAQHCRCLERKQNIYTLEHYLPLLENKGSSIFCANPIQEILPDYFLQ